MDQGIVSRSWNTTLEEHRATYPCDAYLQKNAVAVTRAIDVNAPADVVFRWVCQIKVAPYSYDFIDNLGRRSPRELTPGVENLAVGQNFQVWDIVEYETDHHITAAETASARRIFGPMAVTYLVKESPNGITRLVVRLTLAAGNPITWVRRELLIAGDIVMMRKQLLTLKELAERQVAASAFERLG